MGRTMVGTDGRTWRELERLLREAIATRFTAGQRIPTEADLMRTYGTTRYATRRALTNLAREGLLRIEQGRGTFVHEGYLVSYRLGEPARFTDVLLEDGITPGQEVLRISRVKAEGSVAEALELPVEVEVLRMECLGYADGQVVKHDTNFFPLPRFGSMAPTLREARSVTEALARHGVPDYRRRSTSVVGRLPTPAEARLLRQPAIHPLFEVIRTDVDLEDSPVLFGVTIFSCERVRLTLGLPG